MKRAKSPSRWMVRRGATAVEFALIAPIVFFLFFGFWEWSRVEMMRQTCTTACFEAARRGTLPSATEAQMTQAAQQVLTMYMVQNYTITSAIDVANEQASATVTAPIDDNLWGAAKLFAGRSISTNYVLQLETTPD